MGKAPPQLKITQILHKITLLSRTL